MTDENPPDQLRKEHINAVFAMMTALMESHETGQTNDPVVLEAIRRVINEMPRELQAMAFAHIIQFLVHHVARLKERTAAEEWRELVLFYAQGWPEEGTAE